MLAFREQKLEALKLQTIIAAKQLEQEEQALRAAEERERKRRDHQHKQVWLNSLCFLFFANRNVRSTDLMQSIGSSLRFMYPPCIKFSKYIILILYHITAFQRNYEDFIFFYT